jgi:hypothetical protein
MVTPPKSNLSSTRAEPLSARNFVGDEPVSSLIKKNQSVLIVQSLAPCKLVKPLELGLNDKPELFSVNLTSDIGLQTEL